MFKQAFANYTDQNLTILGLVIFFAFFVTVLVWVSLKFNRKKYDEIQNLPFSDGEQS